MTKPTKILGAAALGAILLAYSNHFSNGFHFDDFHSIVNNAAIRDLRNIPRFISDAGSTSVLAANRVWRPVLVTSLALDYRLAGGLKPIVFQTSTFLWFLAQLVLMLVFFRKLLPQASAGETSAGNDSAGEYAALFAVSWYGLHPALAETVNYICQRGDVYVALGVVSGLTIYAVRPGLRKYGLYLTPVVLAMLAKPPALVFAPLLLAYIYLFETDGEPARWRRALFASAPAFVTVGLVLWLHALMTPKSFTPTIISASQYLMTQPYAAFRAFRTFFLPLWLSADSDLQPLTRLTEPAGLLGLLFLIFLGVIIWSTARPRAWRPVCFGLVWFVLGLLPTAVFPLSELENDHRLFLPFVGMALAVTWTVALVTKKAAIPREWLTAAAVLTLAVYGHGTWMRNEVWHSEESLWRDVTEKSPRNGRGWMNYGVALMGQGKLQDAVACFERALPYTPNYSLLYVNLGVAYGSLGRTQDAENSFIKAVSLAPNDPASYIYLGNWLARSSRNAEAIEVLKVALTKDGDHQDAEATLAALLAQTPKNQAALDPFVAVQRSPTPENFLNLSLILHQAHKYPEAITAAREALRLRPQYAEAYNNIAAAYEEMKDWDKAIDAAQHAVEINPTFQLAKNNLAYSQAQKKAAGAR